MSLNKIIIFFLVLMAFGKEAFALSCMRMSAEQLVESDAVIIAGKVIHKEKEGSAEEAVKDPEKGIVPSQHKAGAYHYKVKVLESWRGPKKDSVIQVTGQPIAAWGAMELSEDAHAYFLPLSGDAESGYSFNACSMIIKYERHMDYVLSLDRLFRSEKQESAQ